MEKAKRFYILFNHVGLAPGFSNLNVAIASYNSKVKSNRGTDKVSLVVRTDKNTEVEILCNKQLQQVSAEHRA